MMDMHRGSRTAAAPGVRVEARSSAKQARGRARDERGQASLEFALALPLLLTLLIAMVVFGIAFNNELTLTFATDAGAQLLSISRGASDPCGVASQAIYSAAPYLKPASLKFTIVLSGTSYTSASCSGAPLVATQTAKVTTTYPCNLAIFGFNPAPNCTLSAQTAVFIQ